jgi:predicted permease
VLRTLLARIRGSFDRDRLDDEFDEEARAHLELLARRFVERGLTPEEAAYAARRQFGRVTRVREDLRARRGLPGIDALAGDLRHAFRQLRRSPGFAVMAAGTLALGIGATTAVFALLDAVVLRPLPYADAGRLMAFRSLDRRGTPHPTVLDYPTFFDFRAETSVFERLVSYRSARFTLADAPPAIQVPGQIVSRDLFELLGVRLALGRGFLPEEERPGVHVAVIDHRLWQSRFGADPGLVGRRVRMNGQPYTVVGVTPLGFRFPLDSPSSQIWAPLSEDATTLGSQPLTEQRGARVLDVIGRLRPGVSPEQAQARMDQVAGGPRRALPGLEPQRREDARAPRGRAPGRAQPARAPGAAGAVSLVLLIACANVANLLLARTTERGREFALRLAVGASRAAVVRQLATEGLAIGLLGAAGGLALAWAVLAAVVPFVAEEVPRVADAGLDARVVGFAAALAVLTSVLFSLAPAAKAARAAPSGALKEGGRGVAEGRSRARSVLVVAQVTLGLVLLVGAELLVGSFVRLVQRDPGFRSENLLTFDVGQPASGDATLFAERLLERLRALPGVRAAAVGTPLPRSRAPIP